MNTSHLWIGIVASLLMIAISLIIGKGRLDKVSWFLVLVGIVAIMLVVLNWNAFNQFLPAPAQAAPVHSTPVIHHLHGKH